MKKELCILAGLLSMLVAPVSMNTTRASGGTFHASGGGSSFTSVEAASIKIQGQVTITASVSGTTFLSSKRAGMVDIVVEQLPSGNIVSVGGMGLAQGQPPKPFVVGVLSTKQCKSSCVVYVQSDGVQWYLNFTPMVHFTEFTTWSD